jgi:3-oxoacyl-[acyl-carrier protein] reductase
MKPTARFDFGGTRVIVTGGTSGIGLATARGFLDAGAAVLVTGTREHADAYEDLPKGVEYRTLRLEDPTSIVAFANAVDRVDVLINNAGRTLPEATFMTSVQVNLIAVCELSTQLHQKLRASRLAGGASVVNLASMMSFFGSPYFAGYGAAKAGVVQLTKSLAAGWAKDGIRVNAVAPGSIPTTMTARYASDPAVHELVSSKTPMGRWGEPGEIAAAILYLCSTAASFVTGHTLVVDGGYSIMD